MTRNPSDAPATRQRQPMTWPLATFGLGVLLFFGFVAWLVAGLIRDLAG